MYFYKAKHQSKNSTRVFSSHILSSSYFCFLFFEEFIVTLAAPELRLASSEQESVEGDAAVAAL